MGHVRAVNDVNFSLGQLNIAIKHAQITQIALPGFTTE